MKSATLVALLIALLLPVTAGAQTGADEARARALEASSVLRLENRLDLAEEALWSVRALGESADILVELAEVAVGQRRPPAARLLLQDLPADTRGRADVWDGLPAPPSERGLQAAIRLRAEGKLDEAEYALRSVADGQAALLELGYIASAQGRTLRARRYFMRASEGADDALAVQAYRELWVLPKSLAGDIYTKARDLRLAGDTAGAERLLTALLPFENRQRVALELGWTKVAAGDEEGARPWLEEAAAGGDAALAEAAEAQLAALFSTGAPPPEVTEVASEVEEPPPAAAAPPPPPPDIGPPDTSNAEAAREATMQLARDLRAEGQYVRAVEEFERGRTIGVGDQVVDMEIAYTMLDAERPEAARAALKKAIGGPDEDITRRARDLLDTVNRRLGDRFLAQSRAYRAEENYAMAEMSLDTAGKEGGDPCAVALERGYLEAEQGHGGKARKAFREAAACDAQPDIAAAAKAELRSRYRLFWADLYAELFGWHRFLPQSNRSTNLVPTVRVRGYIHPIPRLDLDPYVFAQVSRDVASRGRTTSGFPQILADNTAMFGVGVLLRGWKRRIGLYAQIGPAINLLDDGRQRVWLDARVAGFFATAAPTCSPAPQLERPGVRAGFAGCAEVYAEAVWVSRFDNNVLTMGRGRFGFTALVTGPVAWQPIAEVRVLKDINNDYWNNLADAGAGIRWRLLVPFGLDVMLGVHGGSYFGLENKDPAPDPLGFAELRLQAATYIAF